MDPVFTTPPSKRWLENGLTVDPFLVEALQNPCHRLTSKLPSLIHLTNPNLDIIKLGRFPVVKTAVPVDERFERIVLFCNEHQTTPLFGSNEKLNELSTKVSHQPPLNLSLVTDSIYSFASAANVGEREEIGDTREAEDGETRISSKSPNNNTADVKSLSYQFAIRIYHREPAIFGLEQDSSGKTEHEEEFFTTPPSKRWLENGLTVDPFLVEALQNPCHRLTTLHLRLMLEKEKRLEIPEKQKMERRESVAKIPTIMCTFAIVS
ncbi:hypothetical protein F2Q70_00033565 [Brassica cretica]|uniref:Uncharacterized protein n=1 Tax=Brassica cretica TaxID=69181 RepID=A0A8S9FLC7_BRACR|nr:hypothetical protein F2Q70_00033565 [Brassica cretica]